MKELLPRLIHDFFTGVKNFAETKEWISSVALLAIGLVLSSILNKRLTRLIRIKFLAGNGDLGDKILKAVRGPLTLVVVGYFFLFAFDQFVNMNKTVWQKVHDLFPILYIFAFFLFSLRAVDIGVEMFRRKFADTEGSLDESWCRLISVFGKILLSLLGALFVMEQTGMHILPLLTGASFIGAGLALGAQSTIANMIGSFEIMMDRLFKEGDRISFGEYDGFVTKMGLRSVQLTALSGEKINLPNKDLVDKQIRNFTRKQKVCTCFTIGLTYAHQRSQIDQAMKLLKEIVGSHSRVGGEVSVNFRNLGSYTLDLAVCCWADYKNGGEFVGLMNDLNLAIKERFDAAGLDFAFPTNTLFLKSEIPPQLALK